MIPSSPIKLLRAEGTISTIVFASFKQPLMMPGVIAASLDLDCVHTMPVHFENGEKCDGLASCSHENCTFFAGRF